MHPSIARRRASARALGPLSLVMWSWGGSSLVGWGLCVAGGSARLRRPAAGLPCSRSPGAAGEMFASWGSTEVHHKGHHGPAVRTLSCPIPMTIRMTGRLSQDSAQHAAHMARRTPAASAPPPNRVNKLHLGISSPFPGNRLARQRDRHPPDPSTRQPRQRLNLAPGNARQRAGGVLDDRRAGGVPDGPGPAAGQVRKR